VSLGSRDEREREERTKTETEDREGVLLELLRVLSAEIVRSGHAGHDGDLAEVPRGKVSERKWKGKGRRKRTNWALTRVQAAE
jgi:hypothetical protein